MQKSKPEPATLDSKQIFLLLFARELIRNSEEGLLQLKRVLDIEQRKQALDEIVRMQKIPLPIAAKTQVPPSEKQGSAVARPAREEFPLMKSILSQESKIRLDGEVEAVKPVHIEPARREIMNGHGTASFPVLRIPEPRLPPELEYLKPIPSTREIELGKLNPLINDPAIRKIECDGPNKPIIVSGNMGRKPTEIILTAGETEEVIERFSAAAKIPVDVGVFRVVVGNLIFSAIVSDIVPNRFIISKISPQVQMRFRPVPQQVPPSVNMAYSNYINPVNIPY